MSAINKKLDFFVPVTYMPKPGLLATKSISTKLSELAEDFFSYGCNQKRAYVTKTTHDKTHRVKLISCKSPSWKTAVKIGLLFTPLAPIMLAIKLISRFNKKFEVVSETTLTKQHKFEPIRYKNKRKAGAAKSEDYYRNLCQNAGIDYDKLNPLQNHVLFFTGADGNITQKSFQKGLERLGSSKATSFVVSAVVLKTFTKHMNIKNGIIPLKDIAKGTHSANTGVFNKDGILDMDKFESIKKQYPSIDPKYLTANDIVKMRKANFQRDAAQKDVGFGATASKGEFTLALNLFSDCAIIDRHGKATPAISLGRLQKLYANGPGLFEEVAVR